MQPTRSETDGKVAELLRTAKDALGLSLTFLSRLDGPVQHLLAGTAGDPVLQTLVRSLVKFGHGCGAKVVAEGIETAEDAVALRNAGVDYGQGWHFARAGEISERRDVYPVDTTLPRERAA